MKKYNQKEIKKLSYNIRYETLKMLFRAKSSHVGSNLSIADILAHLYGYWLKYDVNYPEWPERDRVILSKGHAAAVLYATLSLVGFFDKKYLRTYEENGSKFYGHVSHFDIPGIEFSTGSLGHGLSVGVGMALALKRDNIPARVIVLMSDGECDEGSTWEAVLAAPHLKLDNLIAIIDYNKIQAMGYTHQVLELEPFLKKWISFRWEVFKINGHNHRQIYKTLNTLSKKISRPTVIIANTIKGKGVDFMENKLLWHYKSMDEKIYKEALKRLK